MKSYYHAHESAYQIIKSKGYVGWGDAPTLAELGDPKTLQYLTNTLADYFPVTLKKKALDLGCGTGTTAFILAQLGFDTTGIDISETAICMGQDLAQQQNLNIQFIKGDVLNLEKLDTKFDLVYDSHCLHCIVFDEDRKKVLSGIKNLLNDSGIFIIDTMVTPEENMDLAKRFEPLWFDSDYILWHKTKPSQDRGVIEVNGKHWCAQRRIYPVEKIIEEIMQAGFKVLLKQIDAQENEPSMLRLVLG